VVSFLSVALTPILVLAAATLVIWFLLQIFKEGGNSGNGKGPDP